MTAKFITTIIAATAAVAIFIGVGVIKDANKEALILKPVGAANNAEPVRMLA